MDLNKLLSDIKEEHKQRIVKENPNRQPASLVAAVAPDLVCLGSGGFGAVFELPDEADKVIRVSFHQFDNWFKAAQYGYRNEDTNFIKVYEIYENGILSIAKIERLEEYGNHALYVALREILERYDETLDIKPVYEHAQFMIEHGTKGWTMDHLNSLLNLRKHMITTNQRYRWDCYARNFMMRGDQLVITDPIS